jgi:hypothetical protein
MHFQKVARNLGSLTHALTAQPRPGCQRRAAAGGGLPGLEIDKHMIVRDKLAAVVAARGAAEGEAEAFGSGSSNWSWIDAVRSCQQQL